MSIEPPGKYNTSIINMYVRYVLLPYHIPDLSECVDMSNLICTCICASGTYNIAAADNVGLIYNL